MQVSIEVDKGSFSKLLKRFDKIEKMDFTEPLDDSNDILYEEIQKNFRQQGAIYQGGGFVRMGGAFANKGKATTRSSSWAPLAPSTRKARVLMGLKPARPIMINSERLQRGFKRIPATKKESSIANNVDHGVYHQTGTDRMPQRRIIGFSNKSVQAIKVVFSEYIKKLVSE